MQLKRRSQRPASSAGPISLGLSARAFSTFLSTADGAFGYFWLFVHITGHGLIVGCRKRRAACAQWKVLPHCFTRGIPSELWQIVNGFGCDWEQESRDM